MVAAHRSIDDATSTAATPVVICYWEKKDRRWWILRWLNLTSDDLICSLQYSTVPMQSTK